MSIKYPTIRELAAVVRHVKKQVPLADASDADDYKGEGDSLPTIMLTIGFTPEDGTWSFQTGDNSYTGGAYGHPVWAVSYVQRRSNSRTLARELTDQLVELSHG